MSKFQYKAKKVSEPKTVVRNLPDQLNERGELVITVRLPMPNQHFMTVGPPYCVYTVILCGVINLSYLAMGRSIIVTT